MTFKGLICSTVADRLTGVADNADWQDQRKVCLSEELKGKKRPGLMIGALLFDVYVCEREKGQLLWLHVRELHLFARKWETGLVIS